MNSLYDYENNITVNTTPNGDKVITMNSAIFTEILNSISDGQIWQKEKGYKATAEQTRQLWNALYDKDEENA